MGMKRLLAPTRKNERAIVPLAPAVPQSMARFRQKVLQSLEVKLNIFIG